MRVWLLMLVCVRPEVDVFLNRLSTLFFKAGSLTELGACSFSWIGWPAVPRDLPVSTPLPFPSTGVIVLTLYSSKYLFFSFLTVEMDAVRTKCRRSGK